MQVGEIMSRRAGLIDPATTVAAAARRMRDDDIGCLLVGRSDRVLGIITDRDIVVAVLTGAAQLGYYVSDGNTTIRASTDADAAAEFSIRLTGVKVLTETDFRP